MTCSRHPAGNFHLTGFNLRSGVLSSELPVFLSSVCCREVLDSLRQMDTPKEKGADIQVCTGSAFGGFLLILPLLSPPIFIPVTYVFIY